MITPEKATNAAYALQGILIHARFLAYTCDKTGQLPSLLDYAENLARLLASPVDETERYRSILHDIADRHECAFILARFDEPVPNVW